MAATNISITLWITQPAAPQEAVFIRQHPVWLHHKGQLLIDAWKAQIIHNEAVLKQIEPDFKKLSSIHLCLYHVRQSRLLDENKLIGEQAVENGDVFVLINTEPAEASKVIGFIQANPSFPKKIPPQVPEYMKTVTLKDIIDAKKEIKKDPPIRNKSAWANGSFYLFTFLVIIVSLGVLAKSVPFYTLALIIIAGVLFIPIIGALQLRQDNRLREKTFMELIRLVINQLPLIGSIAKKIGPKSS